MRNILCDKSNTWQYFDNVGMALPENVKEVSGPSLVLAEEEEIIEDGKLEFHVRCHHQRIGRQLALL